MPVVTTVKTGANDTIVVMQVPDAILQTLVENVQRLENGWTWQDSTTVTAGVPQRATVTLPGASGTSSVGVQTIRQVTQTGEPMKDSQWTRVIEVLGKERAEAIFGQTRSWEAFKIFQHADPKKLERDQNGKWRQIDNPKWDQALLNELLTCDISEFTEEDKADNPFFDDEPVPEMTSDMKLAQIQADSYRGKVMSEAQRKFLEGVIPGAFPIVFPGKRSGEGNSAVNAYVTLASKRIRDASKEYRENVNRDLEFVKLVESKVR